MNVTSIYRTNSIEFRSVLKIQIKIPSRRSSLITLRSNTLLTTAVNTGKMKEEILAAVMFLIKFIEKSDAFPHDQIENFKHHLTTLLLERFEKHWFPERPARGQGYRCIRVNGVSPVDGTLERAASRCGLRYRDLRLPQELTVWVDPAEVCYRLGESEGSYCTLATFPLGSKGGKVPTINTNTLSLSNNNNSSSSYSSSSSSTPPSSASSEASSDCASLSSRSPSPLATITAAVAQHQQQQQQQQQQVYQGPMRRSPFTVNGGGRFVRGVGAMQQQQQQQQPQMQGSCRTAVNMQQQQQQRFMMGAINATNGNGGSGNRLKPREMGYNVQQQQQSTSTNSQQQQRTTPSGTWRCDGPPNAFAPPMFNPLQHFNAAPHNQFNNSHQQQGPFNRSNSSSSSNSAVMGPNGVPAYNPQRMYKNVVRV